MMPGVIKNNRFHLFDDEMNLNCDLSFFKRAESGKSAGHPRDHERSELGKSTLPSRRAWIQWERVSYFKLEEGEPRAHAPPLPASCKVTKCGPRWCL